MSWKERIEIQFKITTGDEKEYFPLLSQRNSADLDMMAGSFEFSLVDGSLVKRKSSNGITYPLLFSFTGDNHLNEADAFIESARNRKFWVMQHPKYGIKNVQPLSIKRSDNNLNQTIFDVAVKETIIRNYPSTVSSKYDSITSHSENTKLQSLNSFGAAVKNVSADDKLIITNSITQTYEQYKQFTTTTDEATALDNAYNKALAATDDLNSDYNQVQTFVALPNNYTSSVSSRIVQLRRGYDTAKEDVSTFSLKEYFQSTAATIISAICDTSINPGDDDYSRRKDIDTISAQIQDIYQDYIDTLGTLMDDNLSVAEAFNPDPNTVDATDRTVNEALANLNEVIFGALIENIYTVPAQTNIVLLTHLLVGRVNEENINELITVNDFTRDQILQIKKGTEILYFT